MLKDFISYLEEQVANGSVYVLGAQGQTGAQITEAWIKKREHYIKSKYTRAITFWKSQLGKGYTALRAFDCSGLGMYWLYNQNKLYSGDLTAHGMFSKCDAIARDQLRVGDWVGRKNSVGRKYHIGYVVEIKDGVVYIIECKGRDDGVVKRHINASGTTYWNCYGRPKIFKNEIENEEEEMLSKNSDPKLIAEFQQELIDTGYGGDMNASIVAQVLAGTYTSDTLWGDKTNAAIRAFKKAHGLSEDTIVNELVHLEIGKEYRKQIKSKDSKINAAKAALG